MGDSPVPQPERTAMKISPLVVAKLTGQSMGQLPQRPQEPRLKRAEALMSEYRLPQYPPNVGPSLDDPKRRANDAAVQEAIGWAQSVYPGTGFLGFPFLAELAQISEYRQISSRMAQEMTRSWITLRSRSEQNKSEEIAKLQAAMERLEVQNAFRTVAEYDGLFGRGQLYLDMGVPFEDAEEMETPLLLDANKIPLGSLKRLQPIEPMWSYGYDYEAGDPLRPDFYKPRTWYIMKRKVHHTRLLTFISRPLPDFLKPMYAFAGMSMSQLALPTVENFLKMRQSVSNIVLNYSLRGIQTNMSALLQGDATMIDSLVQRIQIYTEQANNEGLLVLDKDMEAFFQHTTPMTNIDKLLEQARDNMCAVANIPRMVLFGLSPEGMNATASGELKVFEQYIAGVQETLFRHPLEKLLQVLQLSELGGVDPDITFDFAPLREMDAKELADIRNLNAQADKIYTVDVKAIASDEVRARLARDPNSGYDNLDVNRKVVPEDPGAENV